ncbi:MAG: hypothetical protein M1822_009963 [Bathelium mastoideum]|nr:MAG: hypothetical protein M1822_009963 [Bathelium mastoideum]
MALSDLRAGDEWYDEENNITVHIRDDYSEPHHEHNLSNVLKTIKARKGLERCNELKRKAQLERASHSKLLNRLVSPRLLPEHGFVSRKDLIADALNHFYATGLVRYVNRANRISQEEVPDAGKSMFVHDTAADAWILGGSYNAQTDPWLDTFTGYGGSKLSFISSPWRQHMENFDYGNIEIRSARTANGPIILPGDFKNYRSDITSLNITPSRNIVVTTFGSDAERPLIHIIELADPSDFGPDEECVLRNGRERIFDERGSRRHISQTDNIWSAAPNPFTSMGASATAVEQIAIGTWRGVGIFDTTSQSGTGYERTLGNGTYDQVKALSWRSPRVLAAGHQSGKVLLWDTRTNKHDFRFSHGNSILNIKCLSHDSPYMVVQGAEDTLNLYDFRFGRPTKPKKILPASHRKQQHSRGSSGFRHEPYDPHHRSHGRSQPRPPLSPPPNSRSLDPVLTFPYTNPYEDVTSPPGLDTHESGLLAVGDGMARVHLYSLITGDSLQSQQLWPPGILRGAGRVYTGEERAVLGVRCVRFVKEPGVRSYAPGVEWEGASCVSVAGRRNLDAGRVAVAASVGGMVGVWSWEDEWEVEGGVLG